MPPVTQRHFFSRHWDTVYCLLEHSEQRLMWFPNRFLLESLSLAACAQMSALVLVAACPQGGRRHRFRDVVRTGHRERGVRAAALLLRFLRAALAGGGLLTWRGWKDAPSLRNPWSAGLVSGATGTMTSAGAPALAVLMRSSNHLRLRKETAARRY
jgi:hypothetical protein